MKTANNLLRAAEKTAGQLSVQHNFVQLLAICKTIVPQQLRKHGQLFRTKSVYRSSIRVMYSKDKS